MKRCIFIGQAMPKFKKDLHDWPTLNKWLYSIGITYKHIQDNFYYTALVDYFPGSYKGTHLVPTRDEIQKERKNLIRTIRKFDPEIVIPVGKKSISYCLNREFDLLSEVIGKAFIINPYYALTANLVVIPLPHPSGASTWYNNKKNKMLLVKALNLLKDELYK